MAAEILANPQMPGDITQETRGSCLCNAITYIMKGVPTTTVLCHCLSCKKSSGSAFMANGFYESSQLQITSSDVTLKTYVDYSPDSGGVIERSFCSECGSNLFLRNRAFQSSVIIASGTLEYEGSLREWRPAMEFYCKRKGDWLQSVGATEENKFAGMT